MWVTTGIDKEIDCRLAPYIPKESTGDEEGGSMPLNYFHLSLILALSKLFGGED
jgi:hypothetical protein